MRGGTEGIRFERAADMRYCGQGFEITVPLPAGPLSEDGASAAVLAAFRARYRDLFNRIVENIPVEAVNWRLTASLPAQDISLAYSASDAPAERGSREVDFPGLGPRLARVYDRYALAAGTEIRGPAVFEERESSLIIGPDATAIVDAESNLVVEIDGDAGDRVSDTIRQGSGRASDARP